MGTNTGRTGKQINTSGLRVCCKSITDRKEEKEDKFEYRGVHLPGIECNLTPYVGYLKSGSDDLLMNHCLRKFKTGSRCLILSLTNVNEQLTTYSLFEIVKRLFTVEKYYTKRIFDISFLNDIGPNLDGPGHKGKTGVGNRGFIRSLCLLNVTDICQ